MRKTMIFLLLFSFFSISAEELTYGNAEIEKIVRIYDGDTYFVNLKNMPPIIAKNIGIRLRGADTPELKTGCTKGLAKEAKEYVTNKFARAKKIELRNMSRDKYFRIDCDVYVDGVNLANELIKLGYAKSYDGETKSNWKCD